MQGMEGFSKGHHCKLLLFLVGKFFLRNAEDGRLIKGRVAQGKYHRGRLNARRLWIAMISYRTRLLVALHGSNDDFQGSNLPSKVLNQPLPAFLDTMAILAQPLCPWLLAYGVCC